MASVLIPLWSAIYGFLSSSFFSTFLSALAGAGFGAWGAQRLTERAARGRELLEGLRRANAVIVLAATISNQALSLKKQAVKPLTDRYFNDRKTAEAHNERVLSGVDASPQKFQAELTKLVPLTLPIEALENLVVTAQLMPGRALALVSMVQQSATELTHSIAIRTEMIEYFHSSSLSPDIFCQDFYGLKRRDGNVNTMYHDSMVSVLQYTDDLAFFASELAEELQSNGKRIRDKLLKIRSDVPKVSSVDFSGPRESGLMPPRSTYQAWLSGFRSQDDPDTPLRRMLKVPRSRRVESA